MVTYLFIDFTSAENNIFFNSSKDQRYNSAYEIKLKILAANAQAVFTNSIPVYSPLINISSHLY